MPIDDNPDSLLARWRAGDQQAASELFQRYATRLVALARGRLSEKLSSRVDAEDVVQSAYRSFFAESGAGRFQVERGGDFWQLLVTITLHKLQHHVARHTAQKRAVAREQTFGSEDSLHGIQADVFAKEPSPVEAMALADELQQVMARLEPYQRAMLELRLQGNSLAEIAAESQCSVRTVIRVLGRAKALLEEQP